MGVKVLMSGQTEAGNGEWVEVDNPTGKRTFQVTISGTASVSIQGSNDGSNAVTLESGITASGGYVDDAPWAWVRAVVDPDVQVQVGIDADVTLAETWWADTAAGDVGLGTTAVTDGDALATTEQNVIATTEIAALAAQTGPIDAQSTGVLVSGAAGGTDADLYLNIRIDDDAAHMPDIVTNGAMAADTDWTKGTGWTIAAGVADCDGTQEDVSDLSQDASAESGISYKVTFTITRTAGTIKPVLGGTLGTSRAAAGTFTETLAAGPGGILLFRADADFVGTLDDVSATPVTGSGTIDGTVTLVWTNLGDIT